MYQWKGIYKNVYKTNQIEVGLTNLFDMRQSIKMKTVEKTNPAMIVIEYSSISSFV